MEFKEEYKMIKKLIRVVAASSVSGGLLMLMGKIGMKVNLLNTTAIWNLTMLLGITVIMALNIQILLEKEQKAI